MNILVKILQIGTLILLGLSSQAFSMEETSLDRRLIPDRVLLDVADTTNLSVAKIQCKIGNTGIGCASHNTCKNDHLLVTTTEGMENTIYGNKVMYDYQYGFPRATTPWYITHLSNETITCGEIAAMADENGYIPVKRWQRVIIRQEQANGFCMWKKIEFFKLITAQFTMAYSQKEYKRLEECE